MFALLEVADPMTGVKCVGHRKLLYSEKLFAALLVAGPPILGQLAGRLTGLTGQAVDDKMLGYINALVGLQALLQFWLPAAFRMGYMVREASWNGRTAGGGKQVFSMFGQALQLLVHLLGVCSASRDSYVRTVSCALLAWQPLLDETTWG